MVFTDDGNQGASSSWNSDIDNYQKDDSGEILGTPENPYDSSSLSITGPGTNPCKNAQQPDAQFSISIFGNIGDRVRINIRLPFENFSDYTNTAPCNINKTTINDIGNFNSRKFAEIGANDFSTVNVKVAFFNNAGRFYQPPFRTNLSLTTAPQVLLEYTVGSSTAITPPGTDVSAISGLIGTEIMFTVTLNRMSVSGPSVLWLDGRYGLAMDVTCQLNPEV